MAAADQATRTVPGREETARPGRRDTVRLALVGAVFALVCAAVQLATGAWRLPLGWDETVYVSQVDPRVPSAFFSEPRARGISWLAAPAAELTGSIPVLRAWMLLLAAAGLVLAFKPWTALVGRRVVPVAAVLFAGLWVVQFYAGEVMPNLYVAYGALAGTGWFLRAADGPGRRRGPLWAVALSVAFTALVRPYDGGYLAVALLGAVLAVRAWRRRDLALAVLGGLAAGALPWVAEAYARFGGLLERVHGAGEAQGGLGLHNALGMNLMTLNGPLLCRPCTSGWPNPQTTAVWWLALPLLTALGVLCAARAGRRRTALLAVWCAAVLAVPYLFGIGYAAPRFLVPAYALLAVVVAEGAAGAVAAARGRWRVAVLAAVTVCVALQLWGQYGILDRRTARQQALRSDDEWLMASLARDGFRPPCTVVGDQSQPQAFYAGCSSRASDRRDRTATVPGVLAAVRRTPVALIQAAPTPPAYARAWPGHKVVTPRTGTVWYVFLAPAPARSAAGHG
ncbi:hypothetical protein ACFWXK_35330 [Streptomyces sp. NPDC059070]|uniref:hypothetical protein n=1 Tax=unclassified Streptomyces TaxID=2593676 RepID=UPI0034E26E15